jgi:pimeloyl-ACP methyl ester carboxylesterase
MYSEDKLNFSSSSCPQPVSKLESVCEVREYFMADNTRLIVGDGGVGLPVLFVHGFPFDGSMWHRTVEALCNIAAKSNDSSGNDSSSNDSSGNGSSSDSFRLRAIVPDLRGLGKSELPPDQDKVTMEQFADDLAELLSKLKIDRKVILVGLSMGGYIVMQFARKYSERLGAIVLSSTKTASDSAEAAANRRKLAESIKSTNADTKSILHGVADAMLPKLFSQKSISENAAFVDGLRVMIESNNPLGVAAAANGMAEREDTTELLGQLDIPVLVVCGEEDKFSPPTEMKQLAQKAKNSKYLEIKNAGHLPPIEQPKIFANAIRDFVHLNIKNF